MEFDDREWREAGTKRHIEGLLAELTHPDGSLNPAGFEAAKAGYGSSNPRMEVFYVAGDTKEVRRINDRLEKLRRLISGAFQY
jgi:hypothetical protein